jgi:hypothetical protein
VLSPLCVIPQREDECAQIPGCKRVGIDHYAESWNYIKDSKLVESMCTAEGPLQRETCLQDTDLARLRGALAIEHPLRQNLHQLFMEKCGSHEDLKVRLLEFPDFHPVSSKGEHTHMQQLKF